MQTTENSNERSQEKLTKDLMGLEYQYWKAMQDHDLETALRLTDFPCLIAGPHGARTVSEKEYREMFDSHKEQVLSFELDQKPEVKLLTPDTAVIAYKVKSTVKMEGKKKDYNAVDTSTWVKRDGTWVCALHTEALSA